MMQQRELDKRIAFEERAVTKSAVYGTVSSETWAEVCEVWASVWDMLPSRAETIADGISQFRSGYDIEISWGAPVNSGMRVRYGDRYLKIVSGPSEKGVKQRLVLRCEEYSTTGIEP